MAFTSEPSSGDMVGEVVVISSDSEVEIVEEVAGARHELPSCPICLNDILDPKEKAVVTPCFHVFCRSCLQRWLQQKNLCPLCKGRVRTYIYKILDDNQFSEKVLPPSPPRSPRMDPGNQWPHLSMRGLWTSRSAHPTGPRSSRAPNHNRVDRERAGPSRAESSISQPRPYYWRVQRGCHRLGTRGDTTAAAGQAAADPCALQHAPPQPPTPVQRALLFRRRVYAENMWAAGLADGAGPRAPVADDTVLQQRLREWIMRELKALLREEDVSFLTMYFMGLCASQGLPPSPSSGDNRAGLSSGRLLREYLERRERGEAALSNELLASMLPFLGSSSAHFWHELKCFALSGCPVPSYDAAVRYSGGRTAAAEPRASSLRAGPSAGGRPQAEQGAAGSSRAGLGVRAERAVRLDGEQRGGEEAAVGSGQAMAVEPSSRRERRSGNEGGCSAGSQDRAGPDPRGHPERKRKRSARHGSQRLASRSPVVGGAMQEGAGAIGGTLGRRRRERSPGLLMGAADDSDDRWEMWGADVGGAILS